MAGYLFKYLNPAEVGAERGQCDVPAEMQADWQPQIAASQVCVPEEDAEPGGVHNPEGACVGVGAVHYAEEGAGQHDGGPGAQARNQRLEAIAAEEDLFADRARGETQEREANAIKSSGVTPLNVSGPYQQRRKQRKARDPGACGKSQKEIIERCAAPVQPDRLHRQIFVNSQRQPGGEKGGAEDGERGAGESAEGPAEQRIEHEAQRIKRDNENQDTDENAQQVWTFLHRLHRSTRLLSFQLMPARRILLLGNPILRAVSAPVANAGEAAAIFDDLRATLHEFRSAHGFGRGISAVQIGEPKRLIYIEVDGREYRLRNPEFEYLSEETFGLWDDCFSFPDLLVRVERARAVRLHYLDESGAGQTLAAEGSFAELIQHEMDHLDGILAIDRAVDRLGLCLREEYQRMCDQVKPPEAGSETVPRRCAS